MHSEQSRFGSIGSPKHILPHLAKLNPSLSHGELKVVYDHHKKGGCEVVALGKCVLLHKSWSSPIYGLMCLSKRASNSYLTVLPCSNAPKSSEVWSMPIVDGQIQKDLSVKDNWLYFNLSMPPYGQCEVQFERSSNAEQFYNILRTGGGGGGSDVKAAVLLCGMTPGFMPQRYEAVPPVIHFPPPPPDSGQKLAPPTNFAAPIHPVRKITPTAPPMSGQYAVPLRQVSPTTTTKWREAYSPLKSTPQPAPIPPRRSASLIQQRPPIQRYCDPPSIAPEPPTRMALSDQSLVPVKKELERMGFLSATSQTQSIPSTLSTVVPVESTSTGSSNIELSPDIEIFYPSDLKQIRLLQKGGQGSVQLASTKFLRRVAVKYFDLKMSKSVEYGARELVNLLKVAHHPHLVQTRGVLYASPAAQSRGEFPLGYLMEYMQEGSLHSVVHSRPAIEYETKDVLNWTRQAASALCYLHKKGILHRDVKPANMLLADQRKRLKLCDLGLSNTFDANLTSDVGTVLYMAPEVIAMTSTRTTTYGEKCDVYSLAVCIWEMVHRKVPFVSEGYDLFAIISKIRGKDGIRPTIDNTCDKKIANMIRRCWSFDVDSRPSMESIFSFAVAELEKTDFFEIYE